MTDRWTIERYDHGAHGRELHVTDTEADAGRWGFAAFWSHAEEASLRALVGAANRTHTAEVELDDWRAKAVAIIGYRDTLRRIADGMEESDGYWWCRCRSGQVGAPSKDAVKHRDGCFVPMASAALGPAITTHREEHDDLETP